MAATGGVWFDTKADKVVKAQPEEGVLLSAPGAEVTPDEQRLIDAYSGDSEEAKTVTTKTADKK